jgi:ABC-type spermidine/putrescine transport system permease subunit I
VTHAVLAPTRRRARRPLAGGAVVCVPLLVFLAVFFLYPLIEMAKGSLDGGFDRYQEIFTSPVYRRVMWNTLRISAMTTLICLLIGYPYAYVMSKVSGRLQLLMLAVVLLPFWASLLVRSFAWIALLQDSGLINQVLQGVGLVDQPISLIRTPAGVLIGMVHIMLPYLVLPLFTTMVRIDDGLLRAASSLGATPWQRFRRVFVPLSIPGVAAGTLLVFTISLGFYITPALLGSPRQSMVGEVIAEQVEQFGLATASALGITLLVGTLAILAVIALLARETARRNR